MCQMFNAAFLANFGTTTSLYGGILPLIVICFIDLCAFPKQIIGARGV